MPKHFNHICSLLQVKAFQCPAGEMVVWQRSCVCQHKDFCRNVLSLNAWLQGPLGISLCFLSSGVSFVLSCILRESLRCPQVPPLTEVFPSVCLPARLSASTRFFSPRTSPHVSSALVVAAVSRTCEFWGAVGSSSGHVGVFIPVLELAVTGTERLMASFLMGHPATSHHPNSTGFAQWNCDPFYLPKHFHRMFSRTRTVQ